MERLDLKNLATMVGIYPPWTVASVDIDDKKKLLTLNLSLVAETRNKYFGILNSGILSAGKPAQKEDSEPYGSWQHLSVGIYRTIIRSVVPAQLHDIKNDLDRHVLELPHFLGSMTRPYSNHLRQAIALARLKGIDDDALSSCMGLPDNIIKSIVHDIDRVAPNDDNLVLMPTEIDPVWQDILLDRLHLKTNLLPLKFLLSKLKLASAKAESADDLLEYIMELRNFFLANAYKMNDEVYQVCGLTNKNIKRKANVQNMSQRLVLPSTNNPLWIDLLTGKLSLNSQSIPLRLLISRQRNMFLQANNNTEKVHAIDVIRDYFRKNCRVLKPELIIINRALSINKNTQHALPDPNHAIWQKILNDDQFIPSDHIAYKLLLSKLRNQIIRNNDPVLSIEAAKNIRSFIAQNQKTMRNELAVILQQASAI